MIEQQGKITSAEDFKATPAGMAQRWGTEISAARQELRKFHDDAKKIVHRYLDKRDDFGRDESRVNLFWSTMKVMFSMLYARPPKADVSRAWQDSDDDQARCTQRHRGLACCGHGSGLAALRGQDRALHGRGRC
jgi:hypothetical protein